MIGAGGRSGDFIISMDFRYSPGFLVSILVNILSVNLMTLHSKRFLWQHMHVKMALNMVFLKNFLSFLFSELMSLCYFCLLFSSTLSLTGASSSFFPLTVYSFSAIPWLVH